MNPILIIDDDEELCDLVAEYLRGEGLEVEMAFSGPDGLGRAASGDHALIVLDVMLPGISGLDLLRRLRSSGRSGAATPVLMLTARGDAVDRIVGLELGADDYLPKPFNPRELVARIHAVLRRTERQASDAGAGRIVVGDVHIDTGRRSVRRAGRPLELTAAEYDLLSALLGSVGRVVTRDQIAKSVFHRQLIPFDRSTDMHVSNLRKKLGPYSDGSERIKTVRSVGYVYIRPGDPNA